LDGFRWIGSCFRGDLGQVSTLQNTLVNFESTIPAAFMHPNWYKERNFWIQAVKLCTEVTHFSAVLMYLEEIIKPIIMVNSWKQTCGSLQWDRIQGELKPAKSKQTKKSQQVEKIEVVSDDEIDVPLDDLIPVKFRWKPKHSVWEQKGESYRIYGSGGWMWTCSYKHKQKQYTKKQKREKLHELLKTIKAEKGSSYERNSKLNVIENSTKDYENLTLLHSPESDNEDAEVFKTTLVKRPAILSKSTRDDISNFGKQNIDCKWKGKTKMKILQECDSDLLKAVFEKREPKEEVTIKTENTENERSNEQVNLNSNESLSNVSPESNDQSVNPIPNNTSLKQEPQTPSNQMKQEGVENTPNGSTLKISAPTPSIEIEPMVSQNGATGQEKKFLKVTTKVPLSATNDPQKLLQLINGGNNQLSIMKALEAAGMKAPGGKVLAFRTSTGNFVIKAADSIATSKPVIKTPTSIKTVTTLSNQTTPLAAPRTALSSSVSTFAKNLNQQTAFLSKVEKRILLIHKPYKTASSLLEEETKKLNNQRLGVKRIFTLQKHSVRKLARGNYFKQAKGFLYNIRSASSSWPKGMPRPTLRMAWRYLTASSKHFSSIAHLLRMLHSSIDWDTINDQPHKGIKRVVTSLKGIITIEILDGEPISSNGLIYRYKIRKIYQPFKVRTKKSKPASPKTPEPAVSRRSLIGINLRERTTPLKYTIDEDENLSSSEDENGEVFPKEKTTYEKWMVEDELNPWEVRQYWDRVKTERSMKNYRTDNKAQNVFKPASLQAPVKKILADSAIKRAKMGLQKGQLGIKTNIAPLSSLNGQHIYPKPLGIAGSTSISNVLLNKFPSHNKFAPPKGISPLGRSKVITPRQQGRRTAVHPEPEYLIAKSVLEGVIKKVETIQRRDNKRKAKKEGAIKKQRMVEISRLGNLLEDRKEKLKREMKRKRAILEELMLQELRAEFEVKKAAEGEEIIRMDTIEESDDALLQVDEEEDGEEESLVSELPTPQAVKKRVSTDNNEDLEPEHKKKKKKVKKTSLTKEIKEKIEPVIKASKQVAPSTPKKANTVGAAAKKTDTKLYCICKTPYEDTKFYVGCDLCNDWFHGTCVGVSETDAKTMDEFICKECSKQNKIVEEKELYCLCKQPYDDLQFYIGCDFCQDWFHGTCVGITQIEAAGIKQYRCPNCCDKNDQNLIELRKLSTKEIDGLKRLHRSLKSHKMAWPFQQPVDATDIPDYYEQIKEPMDFETMSKKLREKKYTTLAEFVADVSRIFNNCRIFNPPDSSFYKCAEVLDNFFVQKLKGFKNTLMKGR